MKFSRWAKKKRREPGLEPTLSHAKRLSSSRLRRLGVKQLSSRLMLLLTVGQRERERENILLSSASWDFIIVRSIGQNFANIRLHEAWNLSRRVGRVIYGLQEEAPRVIVRYWFAIGD